MYILFTFNDFMYLQSILISYEYIPMWMYPKALFIYLFVCLFNFWL